MSRIARNNGISASRQSQKNVIRFNIYRILYSVQYGIQICVAPWQALLWTAKICCTWAVGQRWIKCSPTCCSVAPCFGRVVASMSGLSRVAWHPCAFDRQNGRRPGNPTRRNYRVSRCCSNECAGPYHAGIALRFLHNRACDQALPSRLHTLPDFVGLSVRGDCRICHVLRGFDQVAPRAAARGGWCGISAACL